MAASTSGKRRSALMKVPSFSKNADAGRITSAYLVVSLAAPALPTFAGSMVQPYGAT